MFRRNRLVGTIDRGESRRLAQSLVNCWATVSQLTNAILDSYNVASVTFNGTGDTTFTFAQAFAATQYAVMGIAEANAAHAVIADIFTNTPPTAASIRLLAFDISSGVAANAQVFTMAAIGLGGSIEPSQLNQAFAWARWDCSSTAPVIGSSYNVASLTDSGAGITGVNFAMQTAAATGYAMIGAAGNTTDASSVGYFIEVQPGNTPTASGAVFGSTLGNQQLPQDVTFNSVIFIGRH